ncbi:insulinase family protein, partial [Patescibacteria group bacterium]|nr:insulinase family protein [Patescibacteria group bacterium]
EEMNMYEDTPMIYCAEKLEEMMFGTSNPLGRLTIGPRSVIKKVSRQQLVDYKEDFYKMNNMVIAVSGMLPKNTSNKIREYFHDKLPQGKIKEIQKFINVQQNKKILLNYKKTEQVHLAMGFHGHGYSDKDYPAEVLLAVILGGNMSSRLFINVRERLGLAYFIRTDNATYEDTGALLVQAGLDKSRIYEAITAILDELKKVKEGGVDKKELKRAQDYLSGRVALDLEDSSAMAGWYGKQELLMHELKSPEEKLREYKAVTSNDIKRVAKKIFQNKNLNLSIIGPYRDDKKFKKILSI